MENIDILITGGSGRLGTQFQKLYPGAFFPTHKQFDIANSNPETALPEYYRKHTGLIIHCAAYTDVAKAEIDNYACHKLNVVGTKKLLKFANDIPFVYISTEYAADPINYYSKTKQAAERLVAQHPHHLIIRTLFKPRPYPFDRAFYDQYTMGDYVDVIAPLIKKKIDAWDMKTSELAYIGTGRKSIYNLAKQTKPYIKKESVDVITWVKLPKDYL